MSDTALAVHAPNAAQILRADTSSVLSIPTKRDREEVMIRVEAMALIEGLVTSGLGVMTAIAEAANRYAGRRGFSIGSLGRMYRLWTNGGRKTDTAGRPYGETFAARDWRIFVPAYTNGAAESALDNAAFRAHVQCLWAETCREDATGNAVQRRLLDDWFAGKDIPGYGTIFRWLANQGRGMPQGKVRRTSDYPDGWSVTNLRRMLPQSRAARTLVQRGEHAAHDFWGDQLLRDRSKLMPFELITLDDVRLDILCIMELPGRKAQVVYPEAVFAIDVATGLILAKGIVGHYTRDEDGDGGKAGTKRGIQQADTRFLLQSIMERFGLPIDWQMHVLLENASASLSTTDMHVFERLTGAQMDNTGLIHRRLIKSGWLEQGGQPWAKGWIESFFHLLHTTTNHLPGTVGRRYDLTPGGAEDKARYALSVCRKALAQGQSISELQLPLLTLEQYHELLDEYVTRLNWRTEHNLQGFGRVHEVELNPGEWISHDDPRAALMMYEGAMLQSRMESPAERFSRLMRGHRMQPVHPHQLLPLSMDKRPVSVRSGKVTITRSGRDNLIFSDPSCADRLDEFDGRDKALIGFLSADESQIHLFTNDDDLAYVCSPSAVRRVDLRDHDAVLCRAGEVDRSRDRIRDDVAELLAPREARYAAMREHNEAVLAAPRSAVADAIAAAEDDLRRTAMRAKSISAATQARLAADTQILAARTPSKPSAPDLSAMEDDTLSLLGKR
jgi:hypothetical protein